MKKLILFLSIFIATGLLFVNFYNSLIDARSWNADVPNSIAAAREYFKNVNPGDFFRIFSPINQLLGILVLILFWKSSRSVRLTLGIALLTYLIAEGLTFMYFFPRNEILFQSGNLNDIETMQRIASEWAAMNWVRTGILCIGVFFSSLSLHRILSKNTQKTMIPKVAITEAAIA